jgi:hypothetical protein
VESCRTIPSASRRRRRRDRVPQQSLPPSAYR